GRGQEGLMVVCTASWRHGLFVFDDDCVIVLDGSEEHAGWGHDWFPLPGQAVFDRDHQQVAAVSRAPGNLDLFVIGNDSHIWSTWWNDHAGWAPDWFPLPGQAVFDRDHQQVAAVSRSPDHPSELEFREDS